MRARSVLRNLPHRMFARLAALAVALGAADFAPAQPATETVKQAVRLRAGWNLHSFHFDPLSPAIEDYFAPLIEDGDGDPLPFGAKPLKLVYRWRNTTVVGQPTSGEWELKALDRPNSLPAFLDDHQPADENDLAMISHPDFDEVEKYQAYWLYLELDEEEFPEGYVDFESEGELVRASIDFKRGWNLMGFGALNPVRVSGSREQTDFESILRGSGEFLDQVFQLDPLSQTGFYPLDQISASGIDEQSYFAGARYVAGTGNWFYANADFSLQPDLKTVTIPDTDFPPTATGNPPRPGEGDVDRNRVWNKPANERVLENGDEVRHIVFRFQPYEDLIEEVLPLTIANAPAEVGGAGGEGVLFYNATWHPLNPEWEEGEPEQDKYLPASYAKDAPERTWLKVMSPRESRLLRPDGRVDPIVLQRAVSLAEGPKTGFVSTDIASLTLVADRSGLPVNTRTTDIDTATGAPAIIPGKNFRGEIWITSNGAAEGEEIRKILVSVEIPPLGGTYEGKAYIDRVNGVTTDPPFSVDLSLSLIEAEGEKSIGVIDSERVLLYPRDVPLTGSKLTEDGDRYIFTGSFFLPRGDINRPPYEQFAGLPLDDGVGDVDWNGDGKYDATNPLPYDIDRSMTLFALRESDRAVSGTFTETIEGLGTPSMQISGEFELVRTGVSPRKRSSTAWSNPRIVPMDRTGTSPYEEIRSTIEIDRALRIEDVWVGVEMDHPRIEDLEIVLEAPDLSQYRVFPPNDNESDPTRLLNYDGGTSNLFEFFTSRGTTQEGEAASDDKRVRERPSDDLGRLRGSVAGGASVFGVSGGTGNVLAAPTVTLPAKIDSFYTTNMLEVLARTQQDYQGHESENPDGLVLGTAYVHDANVDPRLVPYRGCLELPANDDPLSTGTVVSVLVIADAKGSAATDVRAIRSYNLGVGYPTELLEFVDVSRVAACSPGTLSFNAPPRVDPRQGIVFVSSADPQSVMTEGALFLARFRVKRGGLNYSITLAPSRSRWTLIVRDPVQGPVEPVPYPRLLAWSMRVQTSGGTIEGYALDAQTLAPVVGAEIGLFGRETIPVLASDAQGYFHFDGREFGTYTVSALHPDYEVESRRVRFFESENNPLTIPPLLMRRRAGFSEAGRYELDARPFETTVRDGETAEIDLVLTSPQGTSYAGRTLNFILDATTGAVEVQPVGSAAGPVVRASFNVPPGVYLPKVSIVPGLFSGTTTDTLVAPRWLIVRSDEIEPPELVEDDDFTSVSFRVARYSFYTGTSDDPNQSFDFLHDDPETIGVHDDVATTGTFHLRDTGSLDIDRPPLFGSLPGNVASGTMAVYGPGGPQDSAKFFRFNPETDSIPIADATASDSVISPYPPEPVVQPFAFRAFLSFGDRISGAARGTIAYPGETPQLQGVIFHAGSMPLVAGGSAQ